MDFIDSYKLDKTAHWVLPMKGLIFGDFELKVNSIPGYMDTGSNIVIMPMKYINIISEHLFKNQKDKCSPIKDGVVTKFSCKSSFKLEDIPEFAIMIDNRRINVPKKDLFYKSGGYVLNLQFAERDRDEWIIGMPVLMQGIFLFDMDKSEIGIYYNHSKSFLEVSDNALALVYNPFSNSYETSKDNFEYPKTLDFSVGKDSDQYYYVKHLIFFMLGIIITLLEEHIFGLFKRVLLRLKDNKTPKEEETSFMDKVIIIKY